MKKNYFILLLFVFGTLNVLSQEMKVKGKVSDNKGNALPGANIVIKGSKKGVATDFDGNYQILTPKGSTLIFSYLGFTDQEITIKSDVVNVILKEGEGNRLNEVVVGAFGIGRSKLSLGYATQGVKGADIAETQRENFVNALQGRIAGLTVTSTSGAPGSSASIQLRGV
ncbi:MAG: hypothetical protein RL311_1343, partial [Bacteroidota bacterium]